MTRGYSPPRVEVVEYVIRTNGDPEPVTVKTKTVETEQAKLSDFTGDTGEGEEKDPIKKYGLPPCLKKEV
jgi:hypothetical protein